MSDPQATPPLDDQARKTAADGTAELTLEELTQVAGGITATTGGPVGCDASGTPTASLSAASASFILSVSAASGTYCTLTSAGG